MTDRRTVREYVYRTDSQNFESPPDNLLEFRDWLTTKIEAVPVLHRAAARVDIHTQNERWGGDECSCSLEFSISYERQETDEELSARDDEDRDRADRKRVYKTMVAQGVGHEEALAKAEGRA